MRLLEIVQMIKEQVIVEQKEVEQITQLLMGLHIIVQLIKEQLVQKVTINHLGQVLPQEQITQLLQE